MKRFYDTVNIAQATGGWQVTLDGRGLKTVNGAAQIVPTRALAETLAGEWAGQGEKIDPAAFVARDQADFAIDHIAADPEPTIAKLLAFAETDTLCYRADPEEPLFRRQQEVWEPIVTAFEAREGVSVARVSGIMHKPQDLEASETLASRLRKLDPFTLAGTYTMASLSASLCIALAGLEDGADPAALWSAASLEEEWQAQLWGRDEEAEALRTTRGEEFRRAFEFVRLVKG